MQSRNRRAPAPREEASRSWRASAEEERPTTAAGTNLHRLVSSGAAVLVGVARQLLRSAAALFSVAQVWELRERLSRVRGFWAGLPVTVCGDSRMAADVSQEAAPCWTGVGRGR